MQLQEVMSKAVRTVGPETPLREAAAIMKREGIGMLPVVGLGQIPVGVITDRDIAVRAFAIGLPQTTPVREAMTHETYTILQDRELEEALALMESARIGRLLVCNYKGQLTGVISMADATICLKTDGPTAKASRALAERDRHASTAALLG